MVTATPIQLRIRMYNVGFGDCFLLSFDYPAPPDGTAGGRAERHILVDFGSSSPPRSGATTTQIAKMIEADCGGHLDAIVVTHRHRDHLSGFGTKANQKVFDRLAPDLVVRSWTEDPKLQKDAGKPPLVQSIDKAQMLAAAVVSRARSVGKGEGTDVVRDALDGVANAPAITALERLSDKKRGEYLSAGKTTRLNDLVPGVRFSVLGPPLPRVWPQVENQAADDKEYWIATGRRVDRLFVSSDSQLTIPPGPERWIIGQLRNDERRQVSSLVQWLDDAMNNTSVILLIEAGDHVLLFGGDAQIENWSFALKQAMDKDPSLRDLLSRVDLYKVGHHGSRNGTPKSLYGLWEEAKDRPFTALMSTKKGVHGKGDRTVPRTNLVTKLKERGDLWSSEEIDAVYVDVTSALPSGRFAMTPGPTAEPSATPRRRASAAAAVADLAADPDDTSDDDAQDAPAMVEPMIVGR